jgi:hypothetical protein
MVVANKVLFLDAESARRFPDNQIVICFFFLPPFYFSFFLLREEENFFERGRDALLEPPLSSQVHISWHLYHRDIRASREFLLLFLYSVKVEDKRKEMRG